jgi:GT2 family glycosyltransferase
VVSTPTVSVVIVSWNTRDILAQCLNSLAGAASADTQGLPVETIVIDNASADGTVEMVSNEFSGVQVIANAENVGFARACNQGIRASRGRYILLLNPDTETYSGAIAELVRFLDENPAVAVAGPRIVHPGGSLQTSCYPAPRLSRELWRLFHLDTLYPYAEYRMHVWDTTRPRQVDSILGACLLLRREALEGAHGIGVLDERFFIYSEEIDLCTRLRAAGWPAFWVPSSIVMHHGAASTRQVATAMFLRLYQAKVLYFRKHEGRLGAHAYKVILALAATVRLVAAPTAWLERGQSRERHKVLARQYGRLLRDLPGM